MYNQYGKALTQHKIRLTLLREYTHVEFVLRSDLGHTWDEGLSIYPCSAKEKWRMPL